MFFILFSRHDPHWFNFFQHHCSNFPQMKAFFWLKKFILPITQRQKWSQRIYDSHLWMAEDKEGLCFIILMYFLMGTKDPFKEKKGPFTKINPQNTLTQTSDEISLNFENLRRGRAGWKPEWLDVALKRTSGSTRARTTLVFASVYRCPAQGQPL